MTALRFLVEENPEGDFLARAVGPAIFAEADDRAALHENIRDAVACHVDEADAPKVVRLHFVREDLLALGSYRGRWEHLSWSRRYDGSGTRSPTRPGAISARPVPGRATIP